MLLNPEYRHALIVGTNKCGTTSLFRYLGMHPEVTACREKEAGFFLRNRNSRADETYQAYIDLFEPISNRKSWLLEATPTYLDRGRDVAERIQAILDQPRLIVIIREPISRLLSFYNSARMTNLYGLSDLSFDAFASMALKNASDGRQDPLQLNQFGRQITKAQYGQLLLTYSECFPIPHILILFFDDLLSSPKAVMCQICRFLNIDSTIYLSSHFHIENRSRDIRSTKIQYFAAKLNSLFEAHLNRRPAMRNVLRQLYYRINTSGPLATNSPATINSSLLKELDAYYEPYNQETGATLKTVFQIKKLPNWLTF